MDESKIDSEAMGRLAKALTFICGPKHADAQVFASSIQEVVDARI